MVVEEQISHEPASQSQIENDASPTNLVFFKDSWKSQRLAWQYFLKGSLKNPRTNRFPVKCIFCETVLDGRLERMQHHLTKDCSKILLQDKSMVIQEIENIKLKQQLDKSKTSPAITSGTDQKKRKLEDMASDRILPIDLKETTVSYIIEADVPGFTKEQIEIDANGPVIVIKGVYKNVPEVLGEVYHHTKERFRSSFMRRLTLPMEIPAKKIKAKLEYGVLTLVIPKTPLEPTRIQIN
jgi:HSP20 family protein